LRGVAIQELVGINYVFLPMFPIPCSLTTQVNSQNQTGFLYNGCLTNYQTHSI